MVCRFILHCTFVCVNEAVKHHEEILQAQYKIMTYRLWYIITWPILAEVFLRIGCCFTDR
jgi:putative membrane protein